MLGLEQEARGRLVPLTELHAYSTHCPSAGNIVYLEVLTKPSHSDWTEVFPRKAAVSGAIWAGRETAALPGIQESSL